MSISNSKLGGITMQEFETTLTEKGQVTIPLEVRRILGLRPKDKVRFEVEGEVVKIRQAPSKILQWYGSVTPRNKPENFQELRENFEKGVAEEVVSED
jgi:AbrB family looped-hinge helix DNA binding protein